MNDPITVNPKCVVPRVPGPEISGPCNRVNLRRIIRTLGHLVLYQSERYIVEGITYGLWEAVEIKYEDICPSIGSGVHSVHLTGLYKVTLNTLKAYPTDREFYKSRYEIRVNKVGRLTLFLDSSRPRRVAK